MKKVFYGIVVLFLLVACVEKSANINKEEQTIVTKIPTLIPTFIPTPTKVVQPSELFYKVLVDCLNNDEIVVEMKYSGFKNNTRLRFLFASGAYYWKSEHPGLKDGLIKRISAFDAYQKEIEIKFSKDTKNNDVFYVDIKDEKELTLKYSIKIGFIDNSKKIFTQPALLGGYIGKDYCVVEPALLFLTPEKFDINTKISVSFEIPEGWDVITFWEKDPEGNFIALPDALRMTKGPFGFGKFNTRIDQMGKQKVITSAQVGNKNSQALIDAAFDLYKTYNDEIFGPYDSYRASPGDGYISIFIPATGAFYNLYHEEYGLYMSFLNQGWPNYAHMLSHNWTMQLEYQGAPWYLTEGFVEYLQNKIILDKGLIKQPDFNNAMKWKYDWYKNNDGILAKDTSDLSYQKGALLAFMLDQVIMEKTDNQSNIYDLIHLLYVNAMDGKRADSAAIRSSAESLTGINLNEFFNAFVFGEVRYPLYIDSTGKLQVKMDELPGITVTD